MDACTYQYPNLDAGLANIWWQKGPNLLHFYVGSLAPYRPCKRQHILWGYLDADINMRSQGLKGTGIFKSFLNEKPQGVSILIYTDIYLWIGIRVNKPIHVWIFEFFTHDFDIYLQIFDIILHVSLVYTQFKTKPLPAVNHTRGLWICVVCDPYLSGDRKKTMSYWAR